MANVLCVHYENRTMKPVEIVLRREKELREKDGEVNLIKIHCKHICKCHNEFPPIQLIYDNEMF
jgi:hypothetical protein